MNNWRFVLIAEAFAIPVALFTGMTLAESLGWPGTGLGVINALLVGFGAARFAEWVT